MPRTARAAAIGQALEVFVVWARLLDSHRIFPFGELQLSRGQLEVLFLIAHSDDPVTPGILAGMLGVTPGAVTQTVAGLVGHGLVQQQPHPQDGRSRVLTLTAQSRAQVDGFEDSLIELMSPSFSGLSDDELASLAGLMHRIRRTAFG